MSTSSYLAPTASSLSKPRVPPRRITMEDSKDHHEVNGSSRARQTLELNSLSHTLQEEKKTLANLTNIPTYKQL
jgi:serine/threonine-protein kinase TTK/MPS1